MTFLQFFISYQTWPLTHDPFDFDLTLSHESIRVGGCVSSEDEKRVWFREKRSQCEHIFKNFNCPTREWAKWVSEPVNGASEQSKRSEAERCGASERSGASERT